MNKGNIKVDVLMGGERWSEKQTDNLEFGSGIAGSDSGYSIMEEFINTHYHDGWTLSIFDCNTQKSFDIAECDVSDMPRIVSYIYDLEKAYPMEFIGENPISESYVVGMHFSCGHLKTMGSYKFEDNKLVPIILFPSDDEN